jgi:signal peptidase II
LTPAARAWARAIALAATVVVLDQATKQLAAAALDSGESVSLILGFELADVRNTGIAFGLLADGRGVVIAVTLAALLLVALYFVRDPARPGMWIAVGLLTGGAIGNLADRVREDEVIDFFDPPLWPAFNLADVAIVVGIVALLIVQLAQPERAEPSGA